jgi:hypothetical protein
MSPTLIDTLIFRFGIPVCLSKTPFMASNSHANQRREEEKKQTSTPESS